jgi:hypothetical protein
VIAAAIAATGLAPLVLVGVVAYQSAAHSLRNDTSARLSDLAEQTSSRLDRVLFERWGDVQAFANSYRAHTLDPPQARALMGSVIRSYSPNYAAMVEADRRGRVIARYTTSRLPTPSDGDDVAAQPWFRAGLRKPVAVVATRVLGGTYTLAFSAPVRDAGGRTIGVWTDFLAWPVVDQLLADAVKQARASGVSLMVRDSHGHRLASEGHANPRSQVVASFRARRPRRVAPRAHPSFGAVRATMGRPPGEVSEWSKERDWKSRTCRKVRRGFKSRPLR